MFNNPKIICQVCGKAGHIAPQCYHLFDINYVGNANITMNLCSAIGINQENRSETNSVVQSLNLPKPIHSSSGFFFPQKQYASSTKSGQPFWPKTFSSHIVSPKTFLATPEIVSDLRWYMDSRVTNHVVRSLSQLNYWIY